MRSFVRPTPMTDRLYEYVLSVSLREPEAFRAIREETAKLPDAEWQIAPEQGPLLAMLVQLSGQNIAWKSERSPVTRPRGSRPYCRPTAGSFAAS